ncbi:hypothetical protein OS493_004225 [Desmophyllum pertusum]|uniref:Uncharacterized protein n=1 Tax=Desmophyllum pertusum TaxID=174260 RepID=A0A9W9ZWG3_9CNID|nr:hypothetical protein OS493_004225 [Desmophyllum pertusum]
MPALPASCVKVAGATVVSVGIFGVQVSLITDPEKFVSTFVDCLNELTNEKSWKTAGEFTRRLPELMRKALPVVKKGGLVLLSAYFLYRSFELYDRAMNLAKWDFKKHRASLKLWRRKMIPVRDFMETNLSHSGRKVITPTHRRVYSDSWSKPFARDTKKGASDQRWSVFYGVGAIAVCAGSVFVGNIPVMVVTCGGSVGTIAFSVNSYYTLGDTLIKLDTLWEDTTKMR